VPPVEAVTVEPTAEIVRRGASAPSVPTHTFVPTPLPKSMHTDEEWLSALAEAERIIRWKSWTQPSPLPLDAKPDDCVGGAREIWHDAKGVCVGRRAEARYASWPALLKGLRLQREHEPHIADARDLAHAYSATETYCRYYIREDAEWGDGPVAPAQRTHFEKLKAIIAGLGGNPDFLVACCGEQEGVAA
jgi:hypothetical protein